MKSWTDDELNKIGSAEELAIVALRPDGTSRKPDLGRPDRTGHYVRSAYGTNAALYRATKIHHQGYVEIAGLRKDDQFRTGVQQLKSPASPGSDSAANAQW
jgi:hypothetical protein